MVLVLIGLLVLLSVLTITFSFPEFSPIPYFPSSKDDSKLILKALNVRNGQTIVDLGAGDGVVIFTAATLAYSKKLDTKFIAVEINPFLILILNIRRFFHKNKSNIKIVWSDIFKSKVKIKNKIKTFYLYVSPWYMERLYKKLKVQAGKFELIAYFYPVPKVKYFQKLQGKNSIYIYKR